MASGIVAALVAVLMWGFVEAFGRFYPARQTWWRLRRVRGRIAVRAMRERLEAGSKRRSARVLVYVLVALLAVWIGSASLLDKRWYEVVADATPSIIVVLALLRTPPAMAAVAERMKTYERGAGEDPDAPLDDGDADGGPTVLTL